MENYMKFEMIGKGCGGNCVFLVKNLSDNKLYAMKRIIIDVNDTKQNMKNMNEIDIFQKLNHPNLIKYIESFIHKDKLCIVMEYADGGDLSAVIKEHLRSNKKIEENLIWNWFLQICQAIKYIHSKKILHRDIKCQNIFLTKKGQVKIGDFGISKVLMHSLDFAKTPLGTPYFLSPEICSGNKYSFKTDIWMIGCVLYELTCLRKPFEGNSLPNLMLNILQNEILPIPKTYSDELKFLISQLLIKDPNSRPSLSEILKYQFIIYKMSSLGLSQWYDNWDECPNTLSPVSEDSPNFPLFNLKYDALAKCCVNIKETEEDEEEHQNNCTIEKRIITEHLTPTLKSKGLQRLDVKKKYSPSYGIQEMDGIMKELKIEKTNKDTKDTGSPYLGRRQKDYSIMLNSPLGKPTMLEIQMSANINSAQHKYSEPACQITQHKETSAEKSPKVSMEEKIKCSRSKSFIDKLLFINHTKPAPATFQKLCTPIDLDHKSAPVKFNSNSYNPNINRSSFISTPPNSTSSTSNCDVGTYGSNKCRTNNKEFSNKKKCTKEICITMDIDSPEHKTVYSVNESQSEAKQSNSHKELELVLKDTNEEMKPLKPSEVVHDNSHPRISLRYQYYETVYGKEVMAKLVNAIETSAGEAIKTEKDIQEMFNNIFKAKDLVVLFNYAKCLILVCYPMRK